jgi:trehalose-phosphatase
MKALIPDFKIADFFEKVSRAEKRALLLDYDGTLAPFNVERDKAFMYPGVAEIINAIFDAENTNLVLISGRTIKDLVPLLGLRRLPEIWGSHGTECLKTDGAYKVMELDERTLQRFAETDRWFKDEGLEEHYEKKPTCRALHLRGVEKETAEEIKDKVLKNWSLITQDGTLDIHKFDGGIELRVAGKDKGYVVETILSEMGEGTAAAYLGDDLTDEDAFRAIKGKGVGALVRKELHPTKASMWLVPPEELIEFLLRWKRACGGSE